MTLTCPAQRSQVSSDPDGGFVIPKDTRVTTKWNFDLLKIGYAFSFLSRRRHEMYAGAGLNIRDLDVDLSYQASLGDSTDSARFAANQLGPLLTGTVGGHCNFTDKFQANFRYELELFILEFGDYHGSQQEIQLLFEHNTFKHVGLGAGFNLINTNLRAKSDDLRGARISLEFRSISDSRLITASS